MAKYNCVNINDRERLILAYKKWLSIGHTCQSLGIHRITADHIIDKFKRFKIIKWKKCTGCPKKISDWMGRDLIKWNKTTHVLSYLEKCKRKGNIFFKYFIVPMYVCTYLYMCITMTYLSLFYLHITNQNVSIYNTFIQFHFLCN